MPSKKKNDNMQKSHIERSKDFIKLKLERQEKTRLALHGKAIADFNKIIEHIIKTYHPKRIYQWGSLLDKKNFRDYSDIDIALEGITSAEIFFALLNSCDELTSFELDIVQIEKIHLLHAESIKKKGKLIYDASK